MKRLVAKVRRLRVTRWNKLTLGEKVAKVVLGLIKYAAIAAIVIAIVGVVAAVIAGVIVAFAMADAIAGGFENASRAYRPGDRYVHIIK